jgi:D-alanyl-lipoteichoic acid acyltransferase DltB (MBOAT superfamily)
MTLTSILFFAVAALIYGLAVPSRRRGWLLLAGSVVAIYWLQPISPLRPVDFVLPTGTLVLGVAGWFLVRKEDAIGREDLITLGVLAGLIVALALFGGIAGVTPSVPPGIVEVILALAGIAAVGVTLGTMIQDRTKVLWLFILFILAIFAVLKSEPLLEGVSMWLRARQDRPLGLAAASDIQWLGFSYIAFRLIHTLRDRQTGKLPPLSLREYITYLIFFPAYTAGPIDRVERFVKDYRALPGLDAPRAVEGGFRILIGIFKKFVIADSLALFALNVTNATQAQSGWLWVLLYAYAFRLYFDFAGYSDIAIGIGRLFGIALPENFHRPYGKSNLTTFWQSWHMTLSNWARFYVFTPVSRALMNQPRRLPTTLIVLIAQLSTMIVIGLWHGLTANFVIWGAWHGVGLYVHKLWTDNTRDFYASLKDWQRRAVYVVGLLLTFHYVALGWVWFALPDPTLSWNVLLRLIGR